MAHSSTKKSIRLSRRPSVYEEGILAVMVRISGKAYYNVSTRQHPTVLSEFFHILSLQCACSTMKDILKMRWVT